MSRERVSPALFFVIAGILLAAVAALWLPRWWERREYRKVEAIAGVGARILGGTVADARKRVDPGMMADKVTSTLGAPSIAVKTQGLSTHEVWKYYFSDGTLTVNLTDGYVARASVDLGAPKIRQSRRP